MKKLFITTTLAALSFANLALAQAADPNNAAVTQRNVNQETRIENGLQSGQLSTGEAARLEKGEAHIDRMESRADRDGKMTDAEKARIERAENVESRAIKRADNNNIHGNPNSASSQRMQNDVQRDINQQKRIENGEQTGSLTPREAGKLEHGEARDDRQQYRAGRDGHVSGREQAHVQNRENRTSGHIFHQKHDRQTAH